MTSPAASAPARRPWALWTAFLAILLALQASAGAIRPATLAETGAVAAKLTFPAPFAAQLRETGPVLKAAAQRPGAANPQNGHGSVPPLPAHSAVPPAGFAPAPARYTIPDDAGPGHSAARAYRARAPPHHA